MYGYSSYISYRLHIPNLSEQILFGKYMIGIGGKEGKKIELSCRKRFLLTVDPHLSWGFINFKTSYFYKFIILIGAA